MLLYLFITCIPLLLFLKPLLSFNLTPSNSRLLLLKDLIFLSLPKPSLSQTPPLTAMSVSLKRKALTAKVESVDDFAPETTSFLDLPDLALDCILEKLPPRSLASMAVVSSAMRERCVSDRLWRKHMRAKWGFLLGRAARREWQWHIATKLDSGSFKQGKQSGLMRLLSLVWPFSWSRSKVDEGLNNGGINDCGFEKGLKKRVNPLPVDSVMAWYLALETGEFCFSAQVYNRENGHVGFMLSCYDAKISYDPKNDTFQAKYPPHGRRAMAIETSVPWERLRAPPVETPSHDLHVSDCLHELRPGDHIEIQWRRNKEFPYGWWYGMVGHLESCDGNQNYCRCHQSDIVVLDFNQYTPGSRWRHTIVNRRDHREEGNEADGFYGGIRKLANDSEVSTWKRLWPTESLE